ncbi:MAG: 1-hydroxycarotenoid 3,4-desaturase CrtD [Flavobacteriaceae bacterium]
MKKAIVVGAGVAGLASAIRLVLKGYRVTVFESNAYPGGKLSSFTSAGYRFDAGPSLFTMPHFVDALFELAGEDPRAHYSYKKKEVACRYFWEDGTQFNAYGDRSAYLEEVEKVFKGEAKAVERYAEKAKKKYDLLAGLFLERSLHQWSTLFNRDTLKAIIQLHRYELMTNLHAVNQQSFTSPKLVQLFDRYATYNGSNPFQTPGLMTLVQHLESHYGTFIPEGGMVQITQALYRLAEKKGVVFEFNQKVSEICVKNKKAVGIVSHGQFHPAEVVVSNMDVTPTYQKLLPQQKPPRKLQKMQPSSSAVIFYWGMDKTFPELDLHNILFSKDYKKEFYAIFKDQQLDDDPTVYINITAKDVPEDAPPGGENWFVMVNAPYNSGQNWNMLTRQLRQHTLEKIERVLGQNISQHIVTEVIRTPIDIEQLTHSHKGALYGSSSNRRMDAFLRHPNFSKAIDGLYFCGGSVHPGGGIPLCLLSAKITASLVPDPTG